MRRREATAEDLPAEAGGGVGLLASGPDGLENEAGSSFKDSVIRHQRDAETERGGCDPAVGVVVTPLAEGVPGPFAGSPQFGVGANEITARMDDLSACDLRFQALQLRRAPPSEKGAIAELGDSLEREEGRSADEKGLVPLGE